MTVLRLLVSIFAITAFSWINFFLNAAGTIISGNAAVLQLQNSNVSYIESIGLMRLGGHLGLSSLILLALLVLVWWGPITRLFAASKSPAGYAGMFVVLGAVAALMAPHPAQAYYDKSDYSEAIYVLPNQSAFVIPDVGDNKDSQAQFMSREYLDAKKVPSKRVLVPHVKLENSGLWSNFYVPSARIILVTRTPFNREWVTDTNRGTSNKNDGLPCQSADGLNITTGVSMGVTVQEEGASRYLYHFGTLPPKGDPAAPETQFTSIYYARAVDDVMDKVGRGEILALVCGEIMKKSLVEDNKAAGDIIANVRKAAEPYFAERGITIDYLGWADTFSFDAAVQKAINDKFLADMVAPVLPTLQALADVRVKEGLGEGLKTHGLPANLVVLPQGMSDLTTLFTHPTAAPAK